MNELPKWSVNYAWTQSYPGWHMPQANPNPTRLHDEMIRIEAVDRIIDCMSEYPLALACIERLKTLGGTDA